MHQLAFTQHEASPKVHRIRRGSLRESLTLLKSPSLPHALLAIVGDWLAIVAALALARWLDTAASYVVAAWFIGTRQHALGIMGHEGTHRLLSRVRWLNNSLTQVLCMWPLHSEMHSYGDFHLTHHRHLNTARDPEMKYRITGKSGWGLPRRRRQFAAQFIIDLLGGGALESLRVLRFTMPNTWRRATGPVLVAAIGIGACIATAQAWILAVWYAGFLTGFPAVWRLRCWLEHMGSSDTHRVQVPAWAAWFFAPHHIWMHWEHHHYPGIPLHRLAAARQLIALPPVIGLGDLLSYYESCAPVAAGVPTKQV